jgi:hypothetical protein
MSPLRALNVIAVSFAGIAPFASVLLKASQGTCKFCDDDVGNIALESRVLRLVSEIFNVPMAYILLLAYVQLHAVSGVLLYLTTEKYIKSRQPHNHEGLTSCGALMVAIFLVHPLRVELVENLTSGSLLTMLSLCLSLLGLFLTSEYLFVSSHDESYAIFTCGCAALVLTAAVAIDVSSVSQLYVSHNIFIL